MPIKHFKIGKDMKIKIEGWLCWVKWLKNVLGQGFIFHEIIPAHYTFW